jgi:hypothetical protein
VCLAVLSTAKVQRHPSALQDASPVSGHTAPAPIGRWPLDIRFAEFDHFRALRAPGGGCPSLRAASGPRNQLLGAARRGRAAQQHSALGPIWAFLGHTSPRGVVTGRFLDAELIGSIAVADRAGLGRRRRFRPRQTRRDGPIADLLH